MKTATETKSEPALQTFRVVLQPSHWIPNTGITVVGCTSKEDARQKLHDELDRLIIKIEPGK